MRTVEQLIFGIFTVKALKGDPAMSLISILRAEQDRDEAAAIVRRKVYRIAFRELKKWRSK